jgi:ribulose-phosphate 3-epimerase
LAGAAQQTGVWAIAFLAAEIKIGRMRKTRLRPAMQKLQEEPFAILPSLLRCDFGNLQREVERLEEAGVKALHLDVMDGHFVPNLTYGMPIVEGIRKLTDIPLDVHLMVSEPTKFARQFVDAGADCLTIHAEIEESTGEALENLRALGVGTGLALNPETSLESVQSVLPLCDLLLIMSVNAGFGGQAFNPVALDKLRRLKDTSPGLLLEVDGGVNLGSIASCYEAGARLLVVGSAIFGQDNYRQAIEQLANAIGR